MCSTRIFILNTLLYVVCVACLLSPCRAATDPSTILIVGDSLSAAHGIDPKDGWVSLLQHRLEQQRLPYRVVNISSSGDTTSQGPTKLASALIEYRPSIIVLGLGSNDGLRGLSTQAMENNLSKMVELANSSNAQVLLIGFLIPLNYGPIYRKQFEEVYNTIAKRYQLPKVPFLLDQVALNSHLMQEDGLHPNAKAQPIILETVWSYLSKMLVKH